MSGYCQSETVQQRTPKDLQKKCAEYTHSNRKSEGAQDSRNDEFQSAFIQF